LQHKETFSTTGVAQIEDLFKLRVRMLWSNPPLAIVYGAYLEAAMTRPFKVTKQGRVALDDMRQIQARTGLGRNTGTIANLTRRLESLGLLKIINMTRDSRDSMIMVLTPKVLCELTPFFLSEKDFLEATNNELTQSDLSGQNSLTPFFLSEVRLTQPILKESLLPIYSEVTKDKDVYREKDINSRYFYSSTYFLLWGRSESVLGYQRLNLTQKTVLELICTYQFDLDALEDYLGVRKNNLKSRILKPLERYITIEWEAITPRANLLEVLREGFDQVRFDNIQGTIKGARTDYRKKQQQYRADEDKKSFEFLIDLQNTPKDKKAASASALDEHQEALGGTDRSRYEKISEEPNVVNEEDVTETVLLENGLDEDDTPIGAETEEGWSNQSNRKWESTYDKLTRLYAKDTEPEKPKVYRTENAPTDSEVLAALDALDLPDAVSCEEPEEVIEPEPESPTAQGVNDETYFAKLCGEIDELGFKGKGTRVTREVAQALLENPGILGQEVMNFMWLDVKNRVNGSLDLTYADFKRAMQALYNRTSFKTFMDEQHKLKNTCSVEGCTGYVYKSSLNTNGLCQDHYWSERKESRKTNSGNEPKTPIIIPEPMTTRNGAS
jgi:hypothetical protein